MVNIIIKGKSKIPVGTMEDFQRPDHTDFMDASELRKIKFSGIRNNTIGMCTEIWINGDMTSSMLNMVIKADPKIWEDMIARTFYCHNVSLESPQSIIEIPKKYKW